MIVMGKSVFYLEKEKPYITKVSSATKGKKHCLLVIKTVIIIINSEPLWITRYIFFKWAPSLVQVDLNQWFIHGLITLFAPHAQHILLSILYYWLVAINSPFKFRQKLLEKFYF